MSSYIEHIQSIKKNLINNQGIFRSSAIFPLINDDLDTQISFLSYWFIKRKFEILNLD